MLKKVSIGVLIVLLLLFVGYLLLRTSGVQTWLTNTIADGFEEEFGVEIEIGGVDIDFFSAVVLEDVLVKDDRKDTLIFAKNIGVGGFMYSQEKITASSLSLDQPSFNIYKSTNDSLTNFDRLLERIQISPADSTSASFEINLNNLNISKGKFSFRDEHKLPLEKGIDFNFIELTEIDLDARDIYNLGDSISASIKHLSCSEQSGFKLEKLSGAFAMNDTKMRLLNYDINTPQSAVLGTSEFLYKDLDDFNDFEKNVSMKHILSLSQVNTSDIAFFAPELWGLNEQVSLSGKVTGKINNLKGRKLNILFGESSKFKGRFDISGLPDIDRTFISLDVSSLTSNKKDLDEIPLPPFEEGAKLKTPDNIATLGEINFSGNFTGFVNDFVAFGELETAIGTIGSDIKLIRDSTTTAYSGKIQTSSFDLSKFYSVSNLGKAAGDISIEGTGVTIGDIDARIAGVVEHIDVNGYRYHDITVDGLFRNKYFDGLLAIEDDRAFFDFNGNIDFTQKLPKFKFTADIRHLDLVQLNFLNNEYTSFSGLFNLDGTGNDMDNFIGKLSSSDVVICTIDSDFPIEHLEIQASRNIEERRIQMFSTVMDGLLVGEFDFEGLQYSMQSIIADVIPNLQGPEGKKKSTEKFDMYLTIRDFSLISELFVPALQITEGANLFLSMDDEQNDFSALFTADTLSYLDYHANEFLVDLQKPDSSLYLTLMADEFQFSDSLKLNLLSIDARNERDTIYTSIAWGHIDDNLKGDLNSRLIIAPDQQLTLDIEKAKFWIGIDDWQINEQASLTMKDKHITVDSLGIQHADQYLLIDGEIDTNPEAQLNVSLRDIDLSMFNPLLASSNLSISGLTNGDSQLRDLYESPLVAANLNTQRLTMNEYLLGDIDLESKWDNKQKLFDVEGELIKEERKILGFEGFYEPNDEISPLQLTASINEAELAFLNAFIPEGISHIAGAISGDVKVSGHIDAPQLRGDIEFQKASVLVDYLNTTYYFEESASIHEDWFGLDGIHVYDQENNMAVLTGTIVHENFKDWNFDVFLDMEEENFLVLNTTAAQNEMYYGKAFVTGYAGVFGYSNNLEIDVNARSEAGTSLALPLGGSEDVAFGNFVTFVDFSNPDPEEKPLDLSGINLNLELDITPDAEMRIIFDEAVGDEIKGKGKGHINMVINNLSTFSMFGQVEVLEGNYLFTLKNLINKEFGVVKGGTISWYGDPLQAEVNIKAVYGLTAPLYDLMSENSEQYKQRVPVELIMDLSGNLLNPNIGFDIFLPTSNEITRTRVNSAISTEEEMNRQAFALLVLRRFISPPSISKEHNNIGIAENSTELLSSQLSNWLSQISNDFDIGVNYRPGDDISNEELAVALSTQLFNDRLRVSGNFGVAYSTAAQQSTTETNNLIGDLKIEWEILENGKIRLIVYNQSNDYDINNTNGTNYTQGVGIVFQEEFNTLYELFDLQEK